MITGIVHDCLLPTAQSSFSIGSAIPDYPIASAIKGSLEGAGARSAQFLDKAIPVLEESVWSVAASPAQKKAAWLLPEGHPNLGFAAARESKKAARFAEPL